MQPLYLSFRAFLLALWGFLTQPRRLSKGDRAIARDRLFDFVPHPASLEEMKSLSFPVGDAHGVKSSMDEKGIAVITDSLSAVDFGEITQKLVDIGREVKSSKWSGLSARGLLVQTQGEDYAKLRDAETPTAVLRTGVIDDGMVDIFHVDKFLAGEGIDLRTAVLSSDLERTISEALGSKQKLRNINAYVNLGVTKTRNFHVDSYGGTQSKVFVYCTDVLSLGDGPYCYVPGSHKDNSLESINRFFSRTLSTWDETDLSIIDFSKARAILGPAGSVIVSNQSGGHRGYPQGASGERVLLALNFQS